MNNRRIFISGGAGVIGTALVELLLKEGAQILVGDLKPCPPHWIGKVRYRQGDLNTLTTGEVLDFDPEIFFHLAATFERSEETYPFFEENFCHNIQLSHHLISCLAGSQHLKKVVFASSYLIYDPALYQFSTPQSSCVPLHEESPIYPRNICGAAKLFHELELRFLTSFFKEKQSFVSARIFRVYGRHSRDVISRWVRAAMKGEELIVYGSEGKFDYIFADDVAEGLLRLAKTEFSGVVNLGSGHSRSIQDVVDILKGTFPALRIKQIPASLSFEASQADMALFKQLTNWLPRHTLEQGIPQLIAFERTQKESVDKSKPALLITSLSKKMPLIEAVKQAMNKVGGLGRLHGCDSQSDCIGQYGVDVFWHSPPLNALTIEILLSYCQEHHIQMIIPTRDQDLLFYAKHVDELKNAGIQVMVSPLESVERCMDKYEFARFIVQHRFPAIPTALAIEELKEHSRYVVKERWGAGSAQLGLNLSREEALLHCQSLISPIFQPYIEGKEWSIDLYRSREGEVKGCIVRSRDKVVGGESQITTTVSHSYLEELCRDLACVLGVYGHAVIQVIEDSTGYFHVVECNPRFGGASTASIAVGLDSFYWFILESLGNSLERIPFYRSKQEIRQVRYPVDRVIPWL